MINACRTASARRITAEPCPVYAGATRSISSAWVAGRASGSIQRRQMELPGIFRCLRLSDADGV